MDIYLVLLLCGVLLTSVVVCQTYENAVQLKTALMTNYDPWLVPMNNQSEALNVSISLSVYNILDINIVEGTVTSVMGLTSTWKDERLIWNASDYGGLTQVRFPADYGGLTQVRFPADVVWTPNMGMTKDVELENIGEKWMQVTYQSDGSALRSPVSDFKFSCSFNVRYWPFDKQICYPTFFLFNELSTEVLLTTSQSKASLEYYSPNSEWDLDDTFTSISSFPTLTVVNYGFKLKRQSLFYALTIIVPLVSLNLLMCLVFLVPSESGDRLGYIVTLMLAIVVFLILIGDHVPKTSDPLPLIAGYLITIVVFAILCLLATVLNLSVFFREYAVPERSWGRKLVRLVGLQCCTKRPGDGRDDGDRSSRFSNRVDVTNGKDSGQFQKSKSFLVPEDSEDPVTWKDVSKALDKVLFVFILTGTVLPSLVIPAYIASSSEYPEASDPSVP